MITIKLGGVEVGTVEYAMGASREEIAQVGVEFVRDNWQSVLPKLGRSERIVKLARAFEVACGEKNIHLQILMVIAKDRPLSE